jgi:hypothetical protein
MLTQAWIYSPILIAVVALAAGAQAQKLDGNILTKKMLTKRRVTTSFSICPHGTTVELGKATVISGGNR